MKLDKTLTALMLLSIVSISFAYIPQEAMPITCTASKTGTQRVCVIAATVKEDWDPGTTYFPMPDWLTDNFMMPWEEPLGNMDNQEWQYSLTNYFNTVSMGDYNVVGKVNEKNGGEYFVGDDYYASNYSSAYEFGVEILIKADAVINFADYDGDGDGVVDLCYLVLPRSPYGWPDNRAIQGWAFGFDGYTTQDDAIGGGKVKIVRGNTFEVGSTEQENFVLGQLTLIASHEHGHLLSLDDWYDNGGFTGSAENFHNLYAASAPLGMYSRMQTGQPATQPMPYSSAETVTQLGWGNVDTIWENDQFKVIGDFLETGDIFVVPVLTDEHQPPFENQSFDEYFVLSAHLRSHPTRAYWEGEVEGTGLLIWHVRNGGDIGHHWLQDDFSELDKRYDLECAGGKWDLDGYKDAVDPTAPGAQPCHPDDPRPEFGWDRLELTCGWGPAQGWSNSYGGTWSNEDDFFYHGWRWAMTTLTNPSTDAYNFDAWENAIYPAGAWSNVVWREKLDEGGYRQNLATHISFEGIHKINDHEMELCIRRSRIWTDQGDVTDRTTQRKFIFDGSDYHFIYPSKGYIYYTHSDDPALRWYTGKLLGNGTWPALTLNRNSGCNRPMALWNDDGDVMFSFFNGSEWSDPADINLPGTPGPVAIDFYYETTVGQKVHIAYITRSGGSDLVQHAYFGASNPAGRTIETVDVLEPLDNVQAGVSIVVNQSTHDVYVAYGGKKSGALGYFSCAKGGTGWGAPVLLDAVDPSENQLVPFLDKEGNMLRVVYNAYMDVWYRELDLSSGSWSVKERVNDLCGENYSSQIAGNLITWTRLYLGSIDLYGRYWGEVSGEFPICEYNDDSYNCHVTKVGDRGAVVYTYGTPLGPRWNVYYRGPDGFGGNIESDGPALLGGFTMSLLGNITGSNSFSVATTGACDLVVFDIMGRKVTEVKVEQGGLSRTQIECEGWPSGVYFVKAVHGDIVQTNKLVIVR